MRKSTLVFLLLILSSALFAQTWLWGAQGNTLSDTWAVAADNNGNAFLGGRFQFAITFGSKNLTSPYYDSYLVKYDSIGNVIWADQSKGTTHYSYVTTISICTDNNGNVYCTGGFSDTAYFGTYMLPNQLIAQSAFVVKYDNNGNVLWAKQSIQPSVEPWAYGNSIATDHNGNVFVTGEFIDTVTFGSITLIATQGTETCFLVKYDSMGNVMWAKQGKVPSRFSVGLGSELATDYIGNVYLTGQFMDTIIFGSVTLICRGQQIFLVKYDSNGNALWGSQSNSSPPFVGYSYSVVTDKGGNAYITGTFYDTLRFGTNILNSNTNSIFITKYNLNGNAVWAKQSINIDSAFGWVGYSLAADSMNHIYLSAGTDWPGNGAIRFGKETFYYNHSTDASLILKLDTSGNLLCGSVIGTGGDDNNTVAVSSSGKYVYLGGDIYDTVIFGIDTLKAYYPSNSIEPPFIARWQPCEMPIDTIPVDTIPRKEPCSSLFIPTAFSPNKDGQNDMLYVRGNCIKTMDFVIYDRWGNKVFESNSLGYGWDGTYKGMAENTAVFAYYLHATLQDGTSVDKKGNISLIR